jgi:hypothetical protein
MLFSAAFASGKPTHARTGQNGKFYEEIAERGPRRKASLNFDVMSFVDIV